jgi:hypothetical protein
MASLGWTRDLLMVGFSFFLLVITALVLAGSDFALMPLGGEATLLPMSLILVATVSMAWTLRHWTSMSRRRALKGLTVSLSACWITALACIQGLTYREGVFLRTSKVGSDRRPLRRALRLSATELALAVAQFTAAGLLIAHNNRPWLLIFIILVQGSVFGCAPATARWNMRAQRVPASEYRRRHGARRIRQAARRPAPAFATVGFAAGLLLAIVAGFILASLWGPRELAPVPARTIGPVALVEPSN